MSISARTGWLRWWLCGWLLVATGLSFLDRQVLSVLAPEVTARLKMTNTAYSHVTNAFLISYAVMFLLGGRVMDLVGTRRGMALAVGLWSAASALHALARNAWQLGVCRFLLGMGEGGCFPGAAKAVAEAFPRRERALAMGIAIGGASLGAVLAPPLTVGIARALGFRGPFVVSGLIGAVWVATWWVLTRGPRHLDEPDAADVGAADKPAGTALFTRLDVWGLALVRFIVDPVFYFYMFWIPKYLVEVRGVSLQRAGEVAWIPFLALGISNVAGGWLSDRLIRRGARPWSARIGVMAAAAVLTTASGFAGRLEGLDAALAVMALLMLAHGFWITNYVTLISERYPEDAVGTVMGLTGAVGAVGGMLANTTIGAVVDRFSYGPVWIASGLMYPLALLVLLASIPPHRATEGGSAR
jgi:ACS family hexuronate transporter-like MFS transporter